MAQAKTLPPRTAVDRRQALIGMGVSSSALALGFALPLTPTAATAAPLTPVTAWIAIDTNSLVVIQIGSQDMGQGILSGLAQVAASELMVDWNKVRAQHAKAGATYVNPMTHAQFTVGSTSMRGFYKAMRIAGAQVREMLQQAAANAWGMSFDSVAAAGSGVMSDGGARTLTYGQLAASAALLTPPASPRLLGGGLIGKSIPRLDIPAKLNGSAVFGIDVRVPNMLHGTVLQCPVYGGTLPAGFVATTPNVPGCVAAVALDNAVAIVATDTWAAIKGARSLNINWSLPSDAAQKDSAYILGQAQLLMGSKKPPIAEQVGSYATAIAGAAKKIDVTYTLPYLAHAYMEPLACTASVTSTRCDIWAPTQAPGNIVAVASQLTGLDPSKISVTTVFMGGGLGRKFELDYVIQAIRTSMAIKKPVKLTWSREEDFTHDQYRPMALSQIKAGIDASGKVVAWSNRIVSPSILYQRTGSLANGIDGQAVDGGINLDYDLGARFVEYVRVPAGIPVGFWRSVGHSLNCFAVESAIDELARRAAKDPLEFRRALLNKSPRGLSVLNAAAQLANWGSPPPKGHARGIAYSAGFGSYVAQVAEISTPNQNTIKVHRVACAIDCGIAINPDSVKAQIEGGIVQGLSAALWGEVNFIKGVCQVENFHNYRVLRIAEMPVVSVQIVNSGQALGGVGEPGLPPIAPAVANAYQTLTGNRLRRLPFFPGTTMDPDDN
jgi:isoquinoline 1-oxidoreductase beta subunit